jgi:methylmalonyl-CoA/ethylmalonyl-CoA epimerase
MNPALPGMIFDHVGIVVQDIEKGVKLLSSTLPVDAWTRRFDDAGLGVSVKFARDASGVVYELIAPLGENSPVAAISRSKQGTINQLAYRVGDLDAATRQLRSARALPTGPARTAAAFGGARVQFFLLPLGFILELIEAKDFTHEFENQ